MKTPDEIKKGLECCIVEFRMCGCCPYTEDYLCEEMIRDDALAYIQQLEREREAAVEDIRKAAWCCCHVCKHYYQPDPNVITYSCKKYGDFDKHDFLTDDGSMFCGAMEWRGVQKEVE